MGSYQNLNKACLLDVRDRIERKLRGATSMLAILSGENRQTFLDLSPDLQDGFIDVLIDLTDSARRSNSPA
jgi:hypothetical protein